MDAPWHYASTTDGGKPAFGIDELPMEWCLQPGVKLDFRGFPDGHVVTAAEVEAELRRIGHELKPLEIVMINTRAGSLFGQDLEYNREHNNIWPSANRIIEGMLARRHELTDAYEELYSLFGKKPGALKAFLEELSYTPVLYSEAKISKARQDR